MGVTHSPGTLRYRKYEYSVLFFEGPSIKLTSKVFRNCSLILLGTSCVQSTFYCLGINVLKSLLTW